MKKIIFLFCVFITFGSNLFSSPSEELTNRYIEKAKTALEQKNCNDAIKNIMLALKISAEDVSVQKEAELIFEKALLLVIDSPNIEDYKYIKSNIKKYIFLNTLKIMLELDLAEQKVYPDAFFIKTNDTFSTLIFDNDFSFTNSTIRIVEILPLNEDIGKLVLSLETDKGFDNITLYVNLEESIFLSRDNQSYSVKILHIFSNKIKVY